MSKRTRTANPNQTKSTRPRSATPRLRTARKSPKTETHTDVANDSPEETHTDVANEPSAPETHEAVAETNPSEVVSSEETTTAAAAAAGENRMVTLTRKKISNNGKNVLYAVPGLPGAIRFSRSMFDGDPPETMDITANFVAAKEVKASKKQLSPEEQAAAEAKRLERLQTLEARAAKAKERAEKAQARLDKLAAKAKGNAAATAVDAPVDAGVEASA